jgi:hypothetical protein
VPHARLHAAVRPVERPSIVGRAEAAHVASRYDLKCKRRCATSNFVQNSRAGLSMPPRLRGMIDPEFARRRKHSVNKTTSSEL